MVKAQIVKRISGARDILCGIGALAFTTCVLAQPTAQSGRMLFTDERKGNCIACHKTPSDASLKGASNIGPSLDAIKQKYPSPSDRVRLKAEIGDLRDKNPSTIMPPYGKHHILTEAEIDAIVAYLETL